MNLKIQGDPNYLNSERHIRDINNHRIIWEIVDFVKEIKNGDVGKTKSKLNDNDRRGKNSNFRNKKQKIIQQKSGIPLMRNCQFISIW